MANPVGNEIIQALGIAQNGQPSGQTEAFTLAQIAALASNFQNDFVTSVTTVGNGTLLAAALLGGVINRSGPTGPFTDTTDTALAIVAALSGTVGASFYVDIKNLTAFPQTLQGGSGVTMSATAVIPPNSIGEYLVTVNSATAVTFQHILTTSFSPILQPAITALTTVGAGVVTGAGIATGVTTRGGAQSATAFSDTTDIAANIIAAQPNVRIGSSWMYSYQNTTNAPATLGGGTGVTVSGVTVIPANSTAFYVLTYTAAATITMVGIGVTNNPVTGTLTANGATAVVVANTAVSPNSVIVVTPKTIAGNTLAPFISAITAGTGFSFKSNAGDTGVYNYAILG